MAEGDNHRFSDISKICDSNHLSSSFEVMALDNLSNVKEDSNLDEERNDIRELLNRQTLIQYRQYAMEQYPKEFTKQEELIIQLQNQHFKNYWENVHLAMFRHQQEQLENISAKSPNMQVESVAGLKNEEKVTIERSTIMPAQLWTTKEITEFKADILKTNRSHCIKVGSLSTATIKIPTYPDGRRLFWEFATDLYDIGFGLYFEWNMNPVEGVEVYITESSDDEDGDENELANQPNDEENPPSRKESIKSVTNDPLKPPVDELITVYRRESHMEVYCGSHEYPGVGNYILKFDNTYSVWRSKWVYYRIYYTK